MELRREQQQAANEALQEIGAFVVWRRLRASLPDLQAEIDAAMIRLGRIETERAALERQLGEVARIRQDPAGAELARWDQLQAQLDAQLAAVRTKEAAARQEHKRLAERVAEIEAMPRPKTPALDLVL